MPDNAAARSATYSHLTADQQEMLHDAVTGLTAPRKTLPSKYFYDEEGSRLFDEITELDEYYPTRTEAKIMREHGADMAAALGEGVMMMEYGSGSSVKTRILLDHMEEMAAYVPVDISGDYLLQIADQLQADFPHIPVMPVVADFTKPFILPRTPKPAQRKVVYFPGSTIGNFTRDQAVEILKHMATLCGEGGALIGVDLLKPTETLYAAYNDARGVTAQFNLNVLKRLNSELGANFDLGSFTHEALFNQDESRIEMNLFSTREQRVRLNGSTVSFDEGESILTEYSHKYTLESFAAMAATAGFTVEQVWTDEDNLFSVQYLVR